jgi:selenocysteine lyase/cysteine desulfurase
LMGSCCIPLVSCNLDGWRPSDAGMVLDGDYEIAVRTGLHCAPWSTRTLATGSPGRYVSAWATSTLLLILMHFFKH